MDISIFDAFPEAILSGVWQLGTCQHGTIIGNQFQKVADVDVIIDEGYNSSINSTPENLGSDLLIYVRPCQMPKTINQLMMTSQATVQLVANYMLFNSAENAYYMITDAGIGKNQHTGSIEHIELKVIRTEVVNG